jgi:hypothetical protein
MAQKKKQKKRTKSAKSATPRAKLRGAKSTKKKNSRRSVSSRKARAGRGGDVFNTPGIQTVPMSAIRPKARSARVGGGAGDYSGVSPVEGADPESPRELLEEGQAFESEIVGAVQNAPDADRSEVRTREVPEDDVPPEYQDVDTGDVRKP